MATRILHIFSDDGSVEEVRGNDSEIRRAESTARWQRKPTAVWTAGDGITGWDGIERARGLKYPRGARITRRRRGLW